MSKIGINGFGRIGRLVLRAALQSGAEVSVFEKTPTFLVTYRLSGLTPLFTPHPQVTVGRPGALLTLTITLLSYGFDLALNQGERGRLG